MRHRKRGTHYDKIQVGLMPASRSIASGLMRIGAFPDTISSDNAHTAASSRVGRHDKLTP